MPNLAVLHLDADRMAPERLYYYPAETEAYQILDLSPLATLNNLQILTCFNFIIKNISSLDVLEALCEGDQSFINLERSRLYDETEKSRHNLRFEFHRH
jgi:hypothetical protein